MTNEAIILMDKQEDAAQSPSNQLPYPLRLVNGYPFLHYQLSFLSDNVFKSIVMIVNRNMEDYKETFSDQYLGMNITYLEYEQELGTGGNIYKALPFLSNICAFVFSAYCLFRPNLNKAYDFRRMRDTKILMVGKRMERTYPYEGVKLNEKGQIKAFISKQEKEEEGSIYTGAFIFLVDHFRKTFPDQNFSLYNDYFRKNYQSFPLFCLSCGQYFIEIRKNEDLEIAQYEIEENYF